jgi:phytoene dehydrogenase-like protein
VSGAFEVVVIGGGLRGLVAAACAARSGLRTLLLERWFKVGGSALTEQVTLPGYLHTVRPFVGQAVPELPGELEQVSFLTPAAPVLAMSGGEEALRGVGIEGDSLFRIVQGGSGRLAQALQKVIYSHGGRVLTSRTVSRVVVEEDAIAAVVTEADDRFDCHVVIDTVPERTEFAYFGLHLALVGLPALRGADAGFPFCYVADDLVVLTPSAHDSLHAPPGRHAASVFVPAPVAVDGNPRGWLRSEVRERWTDEVLERFLGLGGNLDRSDVLWTYAGTPFDLAWRFPGLPLDALTAGRSVTGLHRARNIDELERCLRELQVMSGG